MDGWIVGFVFNNLCFDFLAPAPNDCNLKPCTHPHAMCIDHTDGAKCVCSRACNRMYDPVCGSDGKTYSNECMMQMLTCEKNVVVTVDYTGECGRISSAFFLFFTFIHFILSKICMEYF